MLLVYTKETKKGKQNNKNEMKRNETIRFGGENSLNANETHKKKHKYSLGVVRMTGAGI